MNLIETDLDQEQIDSAWLLENIEQLHYEPDIQLRRVALRHMGERWYTEGHEPEELTSHALSFSSNLPLSQPQLISELLLGYAHAQTIRQAKESEQHHLRRIAELNGLHRIISAANSTLDLEGSLFQVVETVSEVMGVEACSIYLYDRVSDNLTLRATIGLNREAVEQVRLRMGDGITGWAAKEGRPVAVRDIRSEPRYHTEPILAESSYLSLLAVPIVLFSAERFHLGDANLLGVITIQTHGPIDFAPEDIHFVETVAGELAFFITNAQLYQQTDERLHQKVRELTMLQQVSRVLTEQLNLEEVLRLIVVKAIEVANVDRADMLRYHEDGSLYVAASYGGKPLEEVPDVLAQAINQGRSLAVLDAYHDSRFPEFAEIAARYRFSSFFCMPLQLHQRTMGAICVYSEAQRHFDYDQVSMLATFADEAAIAIENAHLYEESQRALKIKSAMLQEMHHRVRNNLQTIAALLAMQQRRLSTQTVESSILRDSAARIQAIAAVHNLLCRQDIGITTVEAVAQQLIESARVSVMSPELPISFEILGDIAILGSHEATVLAIVLNELLNNAIVHGMPNVGGMILIDTKVSDGVVTVEVRDNGPSYRNDVVSTSKSGLGLQIIQTLVSNDLDGEFELSSDASWTYARVRFPHRISEKV